MCHPDFAEVIRAIICAIVELNAISAEEPRRHHTNHSHWSMREVGGRSEKSDLMENNGRECCEAECEMAVDTGARRGERRSIRDIGEIRSINIPLVYAVLLVVSSKILPHLLQSTKTTQVHNRKLPRQEFPTYEI